jgi:outer membrane lipoprotein-sorting protein
MTRTSLNGTLSLNRKLKILFPVFLLLALHPLSPSQSEASDRNRVLRVLEKMKSHFEVVADYSCEVEQTYFQNGKETQRIFFTYYFRKEGQIRIDFSYPQTGTTLFYRKGEPKATILPIRSLTGLKFRFSVQSPFLKTFTGQQIDQTDMGYFIDFLDRSLVETAQPDFDFREEKDEVVFLIVARDYLEGKTLEKYRITVSKDIWLPLRLERYSLENIPIEKSHLHHYILNAHPGDGFFLPP